MDHMKELEELNKKSLEKLDQYLKAKGEIGDQDSEKFHSAKKEWQESWSKFMDILVYLEKFEL